MSRLKIEWEEHKWIQQYVGAHLGGFNYNLTLILSWSQWHQQ